MQENIIPQRTVNLAIILVALIAIIFSLNAIGTQIFPKKGSPDVTDPASDKFFFLCLTKEGQYWTTTNPSVEEMTTFNTTCTQKGTDTVFLIKGEVGRFTKSTK